LDIPLGPTAKLVNTGRSKNAGYSNITLNKLVLHPDAAAMPPIANNRLGKILNDRNNRT